MKKIALIFAAVIGLGTASAQAALITSARRRPERDRVFQRQRQRQQLPGSDRGIKFTLNSYNTATQQFVFASRWTTVERRD